MTRVVAPAPLVPVEPLATPPTFSIVIPAFRAADTIGETLASVVAQSSPAHELIVADDGSPDELEDVLRPFGSRVSLIRKPHGGVASARNAGLHASSADFVLFVDADDVLLPGKLEALGRLGQARPDLDLITTDVYFDVGGRRVGRFNEANPFPVHDQRVAILQRCFVGWPAARRSRLIAAGGFDESLHSAVDWDCWIRLVLDGAVAGLHDEPLSVYRLHPGSLTDARARALRDRLRALEKARAHPGLRAEERPVLEAALAKHRSRAVLAAAQEAVAGSRRDARRLCLEAALTPMIPVGSRLRALAASAAPVRVRGRLLGSPGGRSLLARAVPPDPQRVER